MSRIARAVAAGYPHHILQRGNYSQTVFEEDADYRRYLGLFGECTAKFGLSVWAYCLMSDHVQCVCVPKNTDSLAKALNTLHMRYSQYFNGKKKRHGHLWQGRFYSTILDDRHVLEAMRYDETNPVRRGLVSDATAYPWSSARRHALGVFDPILEDCCSVIQAAGDWKTFLSAVSDGELVEEIRRNMRTGRPCGDKEFVRKLEIQLNRSLTARPRGRPRKIVA
jgi:putative transposase